MAYFYDHLDHDIKTILLAQIRDLWTHNSTSLEGNSLTLGETGFILEEGLTIQGKPLKDHNEIYGHAKAIVLIYGLLSRPPAPFNRQDLFHLHETVMTERVRDIDQPIGNWKTQTNYTSYIGADNRQAWREYPAPHYIDSLMAQWLDALTAYCAVSHTATQAAAAYADLHLSLVSIHPFFDGNGRMARLLANLPVLQCGFPPIVIPQQDRYQYKQTLSAYQNTLPDLANLSRLEQLPDNPEKHHFIGLCNSYWQETLHLLANANAIQEKRRQSKA
ncbi:Fic family protein [Methylovulum psychrotolerans]|uniref:Cell filamentation protein Fic n=1 Tax=Methylovulum psychrotolerans TaxID=1704499 RepID=A0A1Z4BTQ3_9GAMM|nr:Fic family protein [Methylovulum psychrotolerans]ASF44638.1 cell filamentation protein Fic [Methylovulum psychrotolerans]MBT9098742.1 Fic family protein [Methylovulum psychrotolerans]